jgi:hypothetical protein
MVGFRRSIRAWVRKGALSYSSLEPSGNPSPVGLGQRPSPHLRCDPRRPVVASPSDDPARVEPSTIRPGDRIHEVAAIVALIKAGVLTVPWLSAVL